MLLNAIFEPYSVRKHSGYCCFFSQDNRIQCRSNIRLRLTLRFHSTSAGTNKTTQTDSSDQTPNLEALTRIIEKRICELKRHITELNNCSYDGTMIWKIDQIKQRIKDSHGLGSGYCIPSPFLYSSRHGYKIQFYLYPNGCDDAEGTFMSIKCAIFRGEYDAILQWPFPWKIILWTFDQINKRDHIIDVFVTDPKSNSFSRPIGQRNPASEIRRFCPLAMLRDRENVYILNNTLFIGIMLEMVGIPQDILPELLCFDVALPESFRQIQKQKMIEEFERLTVLKKAKVEREENEMKEQGLLISCQSESVYADSEEEK